jgi:gamma-glutamylputrescine oxidase
VSRTGRVAWDDDPVVAAWPGLPPLERDVTVDACVVGLGASGLAAVDALAERGLSVVGLDAGRIAAGAAGRNGGFLLAGAAAALHRAVEQLGTEDAHWLYRATLAELDRLTERFPDVVRRRGSIRLAGLPGEPLDAAEAADRSAEVIDCGEQLVALRTLGVAVTAHEGELGRGLFLPDDAAVNPARRALVLAAGLSGLYEHSPVIAIEAARVLTGRATVSAGVIIVALDGGLDRLLPELSGRIRTARLQMLATGPVRPRLPGPVYGRWGYDYAQQDESGRLYVGGGRDRFAEAEWTSDSAPTPDVQTYIEHVAARMAGEPVEVTHRWAASVGYTPDGRPLVLEARPGVVACGGYCGTGNLVGPIAARAAVALALDGTLPRACFSSGAS